MVSRDGILRILDGRGGRGLMPPPPFTARAEVRVRFAEIAGDVVAGIESALPPLRQEQLVALVRKLAAHCQRAGWQDARSIEELARAAPRVVDAVIETPRMLTERVSLGGMLGAHAVRTGQRVAAHAKSTGAGGRPPAVLAGLPDGCALVELGTPADLQAESRALGHCVGTLYNAGALAAGGLEPGDASAARYLYYAMRMRAGACRLFSLRDARGRPLATIEYDTAGEAILQVEGRGGDLGAHRPRFFPALCEALHRLVRTLPVTDMRCLWPSLWPCLGPRPARLRRPGGCGTVLMRDGREADASEVDPADILTGRVHVDAATPQALLEGWAAVPCLTVDISRLADASRLPVHIAGTLASRRRGVGIPHLETAGRLHLPSAECAHFPSLRAFGRMWAPLLKRLSAGRLVRARTVYARRARSFVLPAHAVAEEPAAPGGYEHGFRAAAERAELERRRHAARPGRCPCGAARWQDCTVASA
jgi:hypothetical protein